MRIKTHLGNLPYLSTKSQESLKIAIALSLVTAETPAGFLYNPDPIVVFLPSFFFFCLYCGCGCGDQRDELRQGWAVPVIMFDHLMVAVSPAGPGWTCKWVSLWRNITLTIYSPGVLLAFTNNFTNSVSSLEIIFLTTNFRQNISDVLIQTLNLDRTYSIYKCIHSIYIY